jgi:hypothetical protein
MKIIIAIAQVILALGTAYAAGTLSQDIQRSVVRIETLNGTDQRVGTGFYYEYFFSAPTSSVPVIATCWHVVSSGVTGRLYFACVSTNPPCRTNIVISLPAFESLWLRHPDSNVDLAVMPIGPILKPLLDAGLHLEAFMMDETAIPTERDLSGLGYFQDVKFVGYPIGMWDYEHNLPIGRRGITATDPLVDYNGRSEFLVDAAVFPGSSGSPVYVIDEGGYQVGRAHVMGSRFHLLGILHAVNLYSAKGKVEIVPIPTAFDANATTQIPASLGYAIKASRLKDFDPIIAEIMKKAAEPSTHSGTNSSSPRKASEP